MTLGELLASRRNALNFVRLLLATAVIISHSFPLTRAQEPGYAGLNLGAWAVGGFFAISGYLIPQSRCRLTLPEYLRRRARRILPGLWACLAITAFVFAPVAAIQAGVAYDVGRAATYLFTNAATWVFQWGVGAELNGTPFGRGAWNGSLWTIFYEVCCYLITGAILSASAARRHQAPVSGALLVACTVLTLTHALDYPNSVVPATWLGANFAGGWLVASIRHRITPRRRSAALFLAIAAVAAAFHPVLAAAPLAFGLLYCAALARRVSWGSATDLSYGVYLYGWPIAQLLIVTGVRHRAALLPLNLAAAFTVAALSWFAVERRFLAPRREPLQPAGSTARHLLDVMTGRVGGTRQIDSHGS